MQGWLADARDLISNILSAVLGLKSEPGVKSVVNGSSPGDNSRGRLAGFSAKVEDYH